MKNSKRVYLLDCEIRHPMKIAVYEAASIAGVTVNGVYEKPRVLHGTHKTLFRRREVKTERIETYSYYAEVSGSDENIERFHYVMKGYVLGYNSRKPPRQF